MRNVDKYKQLQRKWYFHVKYFHVTIVLCLSILCLKAVNKIIARQTRTRLRKHDVIKVCSIEYFTTQIELVLSAFKSWIAHKIIEYLTSGLLSSLWNIYHTTSYFFDPPCIVIINHKPVCASGLLSLCAKWVCADKIERLSIRPSCNLLANLKWECRWGPLVKTDKITRKRHFVAQTLATFTRKLHRRVSSQ